MNQQPTPTAVIRTFATPAAAAHVADAIRAARTGNDALLLEAITAMDSPEGTHPAAHLTGALLVAVTWAAGFAERLAIAGVDIDQALTVAMFDIAATHE